MTKRVINVPIPTNTLVTSGARSLRLGEGRSACRQSGDTVPRTFLSPAREPQLRNPDEFQETIMVPKVSKAPGPNRNLNKALKHLPNRAAKVPRTYL